MNPRPVFQLRVNLSDAQKAALRALYGDDGETRKIEPRSPAELREILAKSHGHPPVVVLNHHPLPADAMLHGLAQFVAFEDPASERPCRIRNISVEFEDLQSA
ncbi:MAG: hypothetical protein Q8R32_03180, partial [bacterium]|nr:hypothetical protein [bacterium]